MSDDLPADLELAAKQADEIDDQWHAGQTCRNGAAEIVRLRAALFELGDYHDDGGVASQYTQGLVEAMLGTDWWSEGCALQRAAAALEET